jgi:hypothetical protein
LEQAVDKEINIAGFKDYYSKINEVIKRDFQ